MINDFGRAKEFYEKAAEINSISYHTKLSLGQIALIYGELDEAEKYFMQGIKSDETEAGSYYYLSKVAILKGDQDKAINYMKVAVNLEPKNYKQLQRDPVFTSIREEIPKPEQVEKREIEDIQKETNEQMQKPVKDLLKEKKVYNHLIKTNLLIENLNNEELKMLKNQKEKKKMEEIKQKEKGQE